MTKPKEVAKTLKGILNSDISEAIMDRTSDVFLASDEVSNFWKFDLYSRKPGPAYFDGTDLDMVAFLYSLIDREAILNISEYKSMRTNRVKEGQILTSKENRHGKIIGVYGNKNTFSFGIRIIDMNVMGKDKNGNDYIGDFRNFNLTNFEGEWYDGWKSIQFIPSVEENKFLTENEQWNPLKENVITFKHFVHPNRWTSYYGQYYFLTKMLINRLTEEAQNYNQQIKRMLNNGIRYPKSESSGWPQQERLDEGRKVKIKSFQTEIDVPENDSEFPFYKDTQDNLINLTRKRKKIIYNITPKLRFMTRATEFAFYSYGFNGNGKERFPVWLKNVKWERDYKTSNKSKTKWDRLVLFQPGVGEKGVAIRKRIMNKTETISSKQE